MIIRIENDYFEEFRRNNPYWYSHNFFSGRLHLPESTNIAYLMRRFPGKQLKEILK